MTSRGIRNFPGYSVTEDGRVFSQKRKEIELRQHLNDDGYFYVVLFDGTGKRANALVHRLVLEAYAEGEKAGNIGRHLDGNKANNCAGNLAWGTQANNIADRERHGTTARGECAGMAKLTAADVEWIRAYPVRRGMFTEMGNRLQISRVAVRNAFLRRTWAHV